jgi:small conductance mechanosensitive channel
LPTDAVALKTLGFIETMQVLLVNGGLRLVAGIFILVMGWTLASYVKRWLEAGLKHLPLDLTLKPLIASLARYALLIITLVLVMGQFGVQTTSLIAVIGAAGLAIGLAMQGTLSNVAAGVMLLILRPFRVGQFVQAGGQQGTVREIGLFTTIMVTRDLNYLSVPNSAIFGGLIINYSRERLRRVVFDVPVDYANDLDRVEKIMLAAISADKRVMQDPAPTVVVFQLQEYAVMMRARAYARTPDYWKVLYALQKAVKTALTKEGVLVAVTRQAAVIRNEPQSAITAIAPPPDEDGQSTGEAPDDAAPEQDHGTSVPH